MSDARNESSLLSPVQRRVVAAGATALAAAVLLAAGFYLFVLLRRFVSGFQDVLLPLAIAAILATLLRPLVTLCETRLGMGRIRSIVLLYFLVVSVLVAIALLVVPIIVVQFIELMDQAPAIRDNFLAFIKESAPGVWEWLRNQLDGQNPDEYIRELISENAGGIKALIGNLQETAGSVGGFVGSLFTKAAAYAVVPVYLFFILNGDRDIWKDIHQQLDFLPEERRKDIVFLARQFSGILTSFFRGQIIIGLILGVFLAIGFGLGGLKFGIALGLVIGLLNIIPYLGTILGIVTILPLAYFQEGGGVPLIGICALVFIAGQLLTDYYLTPRIMGDQTGMGPMLIIFSIFFWGTALGGLLGMILAIPLTAFFLVFWRLARKKYLPGLTGAPAD